MARTLEHLLVRVGGDAAQLRTALVGAEQQVATSTNKMNVTLSRMSLNFKGLGPIAQQAGFQIGDFAVQVASGQGAMRAFTQQGSQLLGFFGPWGAVVGAAVAVIGAFAMNMDSGKTATERFNEAIDLSNKLLLTTEEQASLAGRSLAFQAEQTLKAAIAAEKLNITEMERIKADQELRARGPRGIGQGEMPLGLPASMLTAAQGRLAALEQRLAELQGTGVGNLPGLQKSGRDRSEKEAESALQDLIGDQMIQLRLQQMSNRERAIEEAVLRASALAMKDYNEHLRDSPLLTPQELEGIKARAAALYDVAAAQDAVKQAQKEAEKSAKAEQKRVEELNRELGRFTERMISSASASTSWKDILINNIDEIATAFSSLLNLDTGGESGLSGIFASIFGAVASTSSPGASAAGLGINPSVIERAGGGRVLPGFDYIVGERKPERVRFDRPGTVGSAEGGGGGAPTFVLNMPGATMEAVQEVKRMVMALNGSIEQRAVKAVWTESKAGGPLAMSRRSG